MLLEKKDMDGPLTAEKMMLLVEKMMEEDNEERIDQTIKILQDFLSRGRKYSRFAWAGFLKILKDT